jgi:hypothetical protein
MVLQLFSTKFDSSCFQAVTVHTGGLRGRGSDLLGIIIITVEENTTVTAETSPESKCSYQKHVNHTAESP